MGGAGSGRLWQGNRATVEGSLFVSMKAFRKLLYKNSAGSIAWTWQSGNKSSVGYVVTWSHDPPIVTLQYRWRDTENVQITVHLEATPTQFGGRRWWFTCPLVVRGVPCRRRAGKLYLPPG